MTTGASFRPETSTSPIKNRVQIILHYLLFYLYAVDKVDLEIHVFPSNDQLTLDFIHLLSLLLNCL